MNPNMNPKQLMKLKKLQKELSNEVVEVEAGDGAVVIQMNGEQKVKQVTIDPEKAQDTERLQKWLESAINQAVTKSQQVAADKMKSVTGNMNIPGM